MTHTFTASQIDTNICSRCNRPEIDHTALATCESCDKVGHMDYFQSIDSLLCIECMKKNAEAIQIATRKLLEESKNIVINSSDLFNAQVLAIVQIKNLIQQDSSIEESQKQFAFQRELAAIHEHLSRVVSDLDSQTQQANMAKLAINKTLRDFGNELRDDIREKIKISDNKYSPPKKALKPKVTAAKKLSPMDRLIQVLAMANGVTFADAQGKYKRHFEAILANPKLTFADAKKQFGY